MRRARAIMVAAGACGVIVAVTGAASPGTWQFQTPPIPGTSSSNLMSVSCRGSFCMAVGSYKVKANPDTGQTNKQVPLADKWNGSKWISVTVPAPQPRSESSQLLGVSCSSATRCMAVGSRFAGPPLAESWNGTAWKILPNPKTPGIEASLDSISCSSASACTAVGSYLASGGVTGALVERWNGTRWAVQPSLADSDLVAVSCPSAKSCTTMGVNYQQWNGNAWQNLPKRATPAGATGAPSFSGISCLSASLCTIAGSYWVDDPASPSGQSELALAEQWNGSQWTIQQTAALPGANRRAARCRVLHDRDVLYRSRVRRHRRAHHGHGRGMGWDELVR